VDFLVFLIVALLTGTFGPLGDFLTGLLSALFEVFSCP